MYNSRNHRDFTMGLQIPGYPEYTVNDKGEVFSHKFGKRRQLAANKNSAGYRYVKLWKDAKGKNYAVHLLVLATFTPKTCPSFVCRHLDGDCLNNNLNNLQWGTSSENSIDKVRHGKHPRNRFTEQDIIDIRWMLSLNRLSQESIGEMYGVTQQAIQKIKSGARHGYVK